MYQTPEQALSAKAALEKEDYSDLHLVSGDGVGTSIEEIVAVIIKGNILKAHARVYAAGIRKGGSLVTVHAPFGGAYKAVQILEKFSPIESGMSEPQSYIPPWDEVTPMSSALQMPVLLDNPTPFSSFWNLPVLAKSSFSLSVLYGLPLLSKKAGPSSSFGFPLLSRNATPLSSLLGLPLLISDATPLSSRLGIPTISTQQSARR
jgi:hypothetical protein